MSLRPGSGQALRPGSGQALRPGSGQALRPGSGQALRPGSGQAVSSDLRELYQEVILDHNKRPRNFRTLEPADRTAEGFNPLCGDRLTLYLKLEGDVIKDASFQGSGCAISKASASMMTDSIKGKTLAQADELFERFHQMVTTPADQPIDAGNLGKLGVFSGVREFPVRVKCASLAWHTLRAAMSSAHEPVTTEDPSL